MARTKALGSNSTINVVKLVSELSEAVAVPEGVELHEDELVIWGQFTRARAHDGWRDFDLLLVAKAVQIEADVRKYKKSLKDGGPIIKNDRGTPIPNPFLSIIDALQRQQLAIIRSLSLNQAPQDPRTLNGQGREFARLGRSVGSFDDLIARPQ
jgi:hypothetical protein